MKVFIAQFVKGMSYSELNSLKNFGDSITLVQYGRDCFIYKNPTEEDKALARKGLRETRQVMLSGNYDLVILDEATIANFFNILSVDDLLDLIRKKPDSVELVITGRKADPRLIEAADLVTEMKEIKHYYTKGIMARKGIES